MFDTKLIPYHNFISQITTSDETWAVVSSINFEERSIRLDVDLLTNLDHIESHRIRLLPFRLVSRRASPWSALELIKDQLQDELFRLAGERGVRFSITQIEYPVGQDVATELLIKARGTSEFIPNLVLDISALPRELALYICDTIFGIAQRSPNLVFPKFFIVDTPPQRLIGRRAIGPSSVGGVRCVYSPSLIRYLPESLKTSLMVFPGIEGFEAKSAVDAISGHHANITVAVGGSVFFFPDAIDSLNANQGLLADSVDDALDILYYFSEFDALRVAHEVVDRSVRLCAEYPTYRHLFLVAPFGAKWTVLIASYARQLFIRQAQSIAPASDVMTDVLVIPRPQYVSLYSRGSLTPLVFEITKQR